MKMRIIAVTACVLAACASQSQADVTPGYDFFVDAGQDSDGDEYWEDLTAGNPSGLGLLLDDSPAVTRVAVSSGTQLTHAYDFPGGSTNNEAGALLVTNGTTDVVSFQNASPDWTTNDVSLEIWFRPDVIDPTPTNGYLLFEDGGGSGLGLFVVSNKLVCSQDWNTNGVQISYNLATDPLGLLLGGATSEFIHVVVTRDSTNLYQAEMYVNAVSVGTANDDDGDWSGGDDAGFGTRGGANVGGMGNGQMDTESLDGQIALIRIYDSQLLTAQEITNNFNAVSGPDTNPPTIVSTTPPDDASDFYVASNMEMTFNESILLNNGGTVTIKDLDSPSNIVMTIPDAQLSVSGSKLTIDPAGDLSFSTNYAVQISATAVSDIYTNYFTGIADDTTWNFTTAAEDLTPPVITDTSPADNATGVLPGSALVAVFDDDIVAGTGNIIITNLTDSAHVTSIDIGDGLQISISSNVLTITPTVGLPGGDEVAILIDAGSLRNIVTLDFAGISDTNTWNFTFRGATAVTWDGSGDMNWTEPDSTSWSGATYLADDTAQFLGAGVGTVTVDAGGVTPGGVVVNSSADYIFDGGSIGGTGSLIKAGSGSLSINNNGATHTFSGDVIISGGSIKEVRNGGLGSGSNFIFAGDATFTPDYGGYPTLPHGVTVSNGVTASFSGSTFYFKSYWLGPLTGSGRLNISGGNNTQTHFENATNTFTGILQYAGKTGHLYVNSLWDGPGSLRLSSCGFHLEGGAATPLLFNQRQVDLYGNNSDPVYINNDNGNTANTITINTPLLMSGTGSKMLYLQGGNTGGNTVGGSITNRAGAVTSITKAGNSKWILAGTNTYTGKTTVSGGTLVLKGGECLRDSGTLDITAGKVEVVDREIVGVLQFGGAPQVSGTWGSSASAADNIDDTRFSGTERLYVGIDFPPSGTVLIVR